jgi:hypothetical protein
MSTVHLYAQWMGMQNNDEQKISKRAFEMYACSKFEYVFQLYLLVDVTE